MEIKLNNVAMFIRDDDVKALFGDLMERLDSLTGRIIELEDKLETLQTESDNHDTQLTEHSNAIAALESLDFDDVQSRLDELPDFDNITGDIESLEENVATNKTRIDAINRVLSNIAATIVEKSEIDA